MPANSPMRFSVDAWDPAYGSSLEVEEFLAESTARVDVTVERPADQWRAIDPDVWRVYQERFPQR